MDGRELKTYEVVVEVSYVVNVKAADEESAAEKAYEEWHDGDALSADIVDVQEIC